MKKALVSVLLLFAFSFSSSQTFSLTDKHFSVYSYYRSYNILYVLAKDTIRPHCYPHLDSVVAFLNNNPEVRLEISTHQDSRYPNNSSSNLSLARAKNIRDYFVSKGIDTKRLEPKGYADKKLVVTDVELNKLKTLEEKEAAHRLNRRVEYTILPVSKPFSLTDTKFSLGNYYRSYKILFYLGKNDVMQECYPHLDSIADFMKNNPTLKFEIGVHTDSRGSATANVKLSEARANAVNYYLAGKGIDIKRMTCVGYGESKLLVPDTETSKLTIKEEIEAAHQKNRRVEFTILAI